MKSRTTKRKIVEAAVGAALGAAIAGPVGALAAGVAAGRLAPGIGHLGERSRRRGRSSAAKRGVVIHARPRRILVPVDFSKASVCALRFAREWAANFGAELCILHVMEPIRVSAPFGAEPVALLDELVDAGRERTKAALEKVANREGRGAARVSVHLWEGSPYEQIVSAAGRLKADMVIIASHGENPLMRDLMGSTAERVARNAPCPVLVIPARGC